METRWIVASTKVTLVSRKRIGDICTAKAASLLLASCFLLFLVTTETSVAQVEKDKAWQILQTGSTDQSVDKRTMAIRVLGILPDNAAAADLGEKALADERAEVRSAAALALGEMGSKNSAPKLHEALKDKDAGVVISAAASLKRLGDPMGYEVYYAILTGNRKSGSLVGRVACRAPSLLPWGVATLLAASTLWVAPAMPQEHGAGHSWRYDGKTGPDHWGDLNAEFAPCKSGRSQSPVDIRTTQKADLPAIQFDYKPTPLHIIDNGHTIMINYASGSSIQVGDKQYELKQFHFHRPSEEKINGRRYDMVVHLVHVAQDGSVAVVAVLLQKGNDNHLIHELWSNLPKEKDKEHLLDNVQVDAANLLPADRGYYTLSGSLTTPPCRENVTWYVLKHPVTVSTVEIQEFSKLYSNNARPTQPLYNRVVKETR
jgi:carbonic anhydrase